MYFFGGGAIRITRGCNSAAVSDGHTLSCDMIRQDLSHEVMSNIAKGMELKNIKGGCVLSRRVSIFLWFFLQFPSCEEDKGSLQSDATPLIFVRPPAVPAPVLLHN